MADVNLGQLAATTWENARGEITDNIFKQHVLLDHLKSNSGTKMYEGGLFMREPLMYGTNSTVTAFSGTDTLPLDYQEGIDAARYTPKFYNVSIVFSWTDSIQNKGKSQIADLLKAKVKQAQMALSERIDDDLYNGAGSNAKELTGLDTIMSTTTTLGEISGTTYSWWRAYVDSTSEVLSFADMRTAKNTANNGNGGSRVSLIVTTQTLYEKIFALLTASYYMNSQMVTKEGKRLADASFDSIQFEGTPVVYAEAATSDSMYMINKDNFKLGIMEGADFVSIKKPQPAEKHIDVAHIAAGVQTIVNRRASLALLSNKTAS